MDDVSGTVDERGREQSVRHRPAPDHADADIGVAARFDWLGDFALGHELSHQNGACGCGRRGSGPRSSITPPQSGQTSSAWPVSRRVRSR